MKKFFTLLLLGTAMPLLADSASTALIVHAKDGSTVSYILSERPGVTFSDAYLVVDCADAELSYPLDDIWKFTFGPSDADTSVDRISASEASFDVDGDAIVLSGYKVGSVVRIITAGGVTLHSTTLSGDNWAYPLSNLPAGISLVSVNGTTFKIAKK